MIRVVEGDVDFLKARRTKDKYLTHIYNRNNMSGREICDLARKYNLELIDMDKTGFNRNIDYWVKFRLADKDNAFKFMREVNPAISDYDLDEIFRSQTHINENKISESVSFEVDGYEYDIGDMTSSIDLRDSYIENTPKLEILEDALYLEDLEPDELEYIKSAIEAIKNGEDPDKFDYDWITEAMMDQGILDRDYLEELYIDSNYDDLSDRMRDAQAYSRNPMRYNGMSEKDFY